GIDEDRAQARLLAAGDAVPFLPLRHAPERIDERPRHAAIVGAEEAAGHRAGPDAALDAARLERPDLAERPRMRIVLGVLGLGREGGGGEFRPRAALALLPELRAEVAEIERG